MSRTKWLWAGLAVLYAGFFVWYTPLKGPLTHEEIAHYLATFEKMRGGRNTEYRDRLKAFMEADTGGSFVMLNAIELHETPLPTQGVEPGETSADVLNKYMAFMTPELLARASHPVLYGQAAAGAMDVMNAEGMETWSTGAGMRYRSRRDMLEIATNSDFDGAHKFKIAAMKKTIAYPLDPWFHFGDPRVILALVFGLIGCAVSWRWASRS